MGAPADTRLSAFIALTFTTAYKRTDIPLNLLASLDNISYGKLSKSFTYGNGADKINLQHYSQRRLISSTEQLNLDGGLLNNWGHTLNYDAVKVILIRNNQEETSLFLTVDFKNERYYIGPEGVRLIVEPAGSGINSIVQSSSEIEGLMTITSNGDITYDLIILGSSMEVSTSSGP